MIHSFDYAKEKIGEVGQVILADRSILAVTDLAGGVVGEGVSLEDGHHGMITRLQEPHAEVMVFSDSIIDVGTKAARTGEQLKITVGDGMLGDTFDALGYIVRGEKDPSLKSENREIEAPAWEIDRRREINKFFATGVSIVDTVVPLGRGQRELVIGDQKTGKTHFALQAVKTQAMEGTICILALVGKEQSEIVAIEKFLTEAGVRDKCILIAEPSKASAARITITPFTAMTVAEYFRDQGRDTLLVIDDLSYHAVRYREMALLSERFPGRDSYPSDIFYLHARLLERAGSFEVDGKTVSITCLPVATTVDGDISGYIETNIMSMTDGHLYFDRNLFIDGVRPAVNVFLSVTRVGRQTQSTLSREVGQAAMSVLAEYGNLKRFLRFGAELSPEIKEKIRLAHGVKELFKQYGRVSIEHEVQLYLIASLWAGVYNGSSSEQVAERLQRDRDKRLLVKKAVESAKNMQELVKVAKNNRSVVLEAQ